MIEQNPSLDMTSHILDDFIPNVPWHGLYSPKLIQINPWYVALSKYGRTSKLLNFMWQFMSVSRPGSSCSAVEGVGPGDLLRLVTLWSTYKKLWKITMFHGKINYKWPCSIAMLVYQRVFNIVMGKWMKMALLEIDDQHYNLRIATGD